MVEKSVTANFSAIQQLQQQQGWSNRDLAFRAGCRNQTLDRIEAGEAVSLRTLSRIARALGVTVDHLLPVTVEVKAATPAPTGSVFVSHSSRDRDFIEHEIIAYLREIGVNAWYSRDAIKPSERFEPSLIQGLEESQQFLLVMSPNSAKSDWVRAEVHWAINNRWPHGICPVMIDECDPQSFHLFLTQLQYVDFQSDRERARQRLAEALKKPAELFVKPSLPQDKPSQRVATPVGPGSRLVASTDPQVRLPKFHCGGIVPSEFFIDRHQQLVDAEDIVRSGQSFLLVGVRRSGKTSFCTKLRSRLLEHPQNDLLASRLNLESCRDLTIETFLGHTILNMIGEIARQVFHVNMADLDRPDPAQVRPDLANDPQFESFVNVNRVVTEKTHSRQGVTPSPFLPQEFVDRVTDLMHIINAKGWKNYVIFYDEANHLPARLSVELLTGNLEILNSAALTTVYAASPEMIDSFMPLHDLLGHQIRIGPFDSQLDLVSLLARYYHGDVSQTDNLPISADALQLIWDYSRGMPFQLQFILSYSFQRAREKKASIVTDQHVSEAYAVLSRERPDHFRLQ